MLLLSIWDLGRGKGFSSFSKNTSSETLPIDSHGDGEKQTEKGRKEQTLSFEFKWNAVFCKYHRRGVFW